MDTLTSSYAYIFLLCRRVFWPSKFISNIMILEQDGISLFVNLSIETPISITSSQIVCFRLIFCQSLDHILYITIVQREVKTI